MGVGINVENLNAWYGKGQALWDINLKVAANRATALIGPSGCGKSTFIRCINRMHETIPEARVEGRVRIGEIDAYNGTSATQLRRRVGMVFQKANPFPTMSIYDNVASGLKLNGFRDRRSIPQLYGAKSKIRYTRSPAPASPAASSSGCALPARSPLSRKSCSWTSPVRPSIRFRRERLRS
jgi:ABC-type phosphate transport system ATPase subunit